MSDPKRSSTPIFVGLGGGVVAIVTAALITGPIFQTVDNGGSTWWYLALFAPGLIAALGIFIGAGIERRQQKALPPAPVWRIFDDEYEHPPIDRHFVPVATALTKPPFGMAQYPPRPRRPLTPEQLAVAAYHARDKRLMDGQGDQ